MAREAGSGRIRNGDEAAGARVAESGGAENGHAPIDRRAIPDHAKESLWHAPDGHAIRRIDYPGVSPKGSILFLPGRGDAYEKYLEAMEEWHRAGWRVTGADWRGQAGSGRLGKDEVTGHVSDFSDWIDDLRRLWSDWQAETPGPHILAAHSMGGHLALRAVVEGAVQPDGLILSAPMLGFTAQKLPIALMHGAARLMARMGDPARPAWKWSEKPGEIPARRRALLTHDDERYEDELWWRDMRPELVMGPGSWGWVERAYASMRAMFAKGRLEAVQVPVLIVATSNDKLVGFEAIEEAAARLNDAELVTFGREARHEILREADPMRARAMTAINAFLDRIASEHAQRRTTRQS
ncbi:Lysophospholipase [Alteripontixanthobacter maritimus]|uniref:Lysophospholipase n=1 Tax=Alteripontixanthobacter maritimus TaxID=2161824 RepID=A0A369Q8P6_9SPHN|nr:alpha/beta hydrolase [Alteripontixanthobacter maritimus]RDC59299.1 Lysophospholipase [Alteripontixanthobacter maritimus]